MRTLGLVFITLLAATAAQAEITAWDTKWQACEADRHCVVLRDPCGVWKAVSRGQQKNAKEYFSYQRTLNSCAVVTQQSEPGVKCERQQCVTAATKGTN